MRNSVNPDYLNYVVYIMCYYTLYHGNNFCCLLKNNTTTNKQNHEVFVSEH